ncbi:hypothetical protein [Moorena sp. SIO4E2]|nr:hypothetical protein [Moorena sp. SIO4E2]
MGSAFDRFMWLAIAKVGTAHQRINHNRTSAIAPQAASAMPIA